jgi:hypothetical protein
VVLKEANYMPNQCTGAKKIKFYPAHRQSEPECNPAPFNIELQTSKQENEFFKWLDDQSSVIPVTTSVNVLEKVAEPEDTSGKFKKISKVNKSIDDVKTMNMMSVPTCITLVVLTVLIMMTRLVPETNSKTVKRQQKFKGTKNCSDECCNCPNLRKLLALKSSVYMILGTCFTSLRMLISQTKRKAIKWTIEKLKLCM